MAQDANEHGVAPPPDLVLCIFCGRTRERSEEHIVPKWLGRRLREHGYDVELAVHDSSSGREVKRTQTAAAWTIEGVCRPCNTSWMSDIEDDVNWHLWPMIVGDPTRLSPRIRMRLALWAQLKWITWDAMSSERMIAPEMAHHFAGATNPVPDVLVEIGAYAPPPSVPEDPVPMLLAARRIQRKQQGGVIRPGDVTELVCVTVRIGAVVMFVAGPRHPIPGISLPAGYVVDQSFVRLWPQVTTRKVPWSVDRSVGPETLSAAAVGRSLWESREP